LEYLFQYHSCNYLGVAAGAIEPLSTALLVAGCLLVYALQARGRVPLGRAFLATLCVVLLTNKTLSAQYVVWVVPFAAAIDGFDLAWLGICAPTTREYPFLYNQYKGCYGMSFHPTLFLVVLAARNGLLLFVTLRTILRREATDTPIASPLTGGAD